MKIDLGVTHSMKKIIIGSDKSGFSLKEAVKSHLVENGYDVDDCGTQDMEHGLPFYKVAPVAAQAVQEGRYEKGILICGTGMGMAIVSNKFQGVYAACCESTYTAEKCRSVNDANILTMGGWIIAPELGIAMVDTFLQTGFTENLEAWRQSFLQDAASEVKKIEKDAGRR